jgi:hypothetical protein
LADFRGVIEDGFGRWAEVIVRFRWVAIFSILGLAVFLTTRIPLMEVETSSDDYLFDGDPAKIAYNAFRDQFGRDQLIFVVVEPPEVFDLEFLAWLRALHLDLEDSVPHLDEVNSLVNIRSVYGVGDELFVDELLEDWPQDEGDLEALRNRSLSTPGYIDSVISADGRTTVLQVKSFAYSSGNVEEEEGLGGFELTPNADPRRFLSARENSAFSRAVLETVDRHRREDATIHLTGQPLVAFALTRSMAQDVPRIFGGALLLVGLMIIVLFRRLSPLLLATSIVLLSLLSTLGIAQLIGFPISLPTQILPSFLLAVGVGYTIHLLTVFFRSLAKRGERQAALEETLREVGLPILMTAVTTIAGLVSFVAATMEQAFQLGITGAIGVGVTSVYALVFLPAVLSVLPLSAERNEAGVERGTGLLLACARLSTAHPKKLVGATLLMAVCALALLPRLDYSADPMAYFPEDHWLRVGTFFTDERLGGMQSLEVVVDTGQENGLYDVEVLDGMEAMDRLIPELRSEGELVTKTWSMLQVLKETHQALNENRPEFYAVPRDERLVAQELLLFENSGADDLESFVSTDFSKARVSILTGWEDGVGKQRFIDRARDRIRDTMEGRAEVTLTGSVAMIARTASASSESLIRSYSLALLLITPIMMLMIGSLRAGLVSMVPNLIPILTALALMVVVGIELDLFTILGACIAIGLAVDDSIHFISGFRRHFARTGDAVRSVELTMESTGRALLFTSVVLVAGFAVLGLSSMANLGYLGLTTAFAIGLAFVLDVTVTPALLVLTYRKVGTERSAAESSGG